jgi:hypothetical protein
VVRLLQSPCEYVSVDSAALSFPCRVVVAEARAWPRFGSFSSVALPAPIRTALEVFEKAHASSPAWAGKHLTWILSRSRAVLRITTSKSWHDVHCTVLQAALLWLLPPDDPVGVAVSELAARLGTTCTAGHALLASMTPPGRPTFVWRRCSEGNAEADRAGLVLKSFDCDVRDIVFRPARGLQERPANHRLRSELCLDAALVRELKSSGGRPRATEDLAAAVRQRMGPVQPGCAEVRARLRRLCEQDYAHSPFPDFFAYQP